MLVDRIKEGALAAMKAKDDVARDILRLALGEIQTAEARGGRELGDDEAAAVVRKLIKSNEETSGASEREDQKLALTREIAVLSALLPAPMTAGQITEALAGARDAIAAARSEGQATGVAMKHLKAAGVTAPGTEVAIAVKAIRSARDPGTTSG